LGEEVPGGVGLVVGTHARRERRVLGINNRLLRGQNPGSSDALLVFDLPRVRRLARHTLSKDERVDCRRSSAIRMRPQAER